MLLGRMSKKPPKQKNLFQKKKKIQSGLKKQHTILWSTIPSVSPKGEKQVTDDDADDLEKPNTTTSTKSKEKPLCKWGAACYQTNKPHIEAFSHPDSEKSESKKTTKKGKEKTTEEPKEQKEQKEQNKEIVPCKFGLKCFNSAEIHRKQFSHPDPNNEKQKKEEEKKKEAEEEKEAKKEKPESDNEDQEMLSLRKGDYLKLLERIKQLEQKTSTTTTTTTTATNESEKPTETKKSKKSKNNDEATIVLEEPPSKKQKTGQKK